VEVFFRGLRPEEIGIIARNAAHKMNLRIDAAAVKVVEKYATNGREAVNIIQIAGGLALTEGREQITVADIEWVVNSGQYSPRPEKKIPDQPQVGYVNGLAIYGPNMGTLLEIEAAVLPVRRGEGQITVTGMIEEEEMGNPGHMLRRKSMARGSVENVLTVLRRYLDFNPRDYDIHLNFPGGIPVDGPSAGVAVATAVYSALTNVPVDNRVAMTGEVSIRGFIKPVGGVVVKAEAARQAGVKKVLIPKENWQECFGQFSDLAVIPVESLDEVFRHALFKRNRGDYLVATGVESLTASTL
jgi:Lon-like ATP-dependent protease